MAVRLYVGIVFYQACLGSTRRPPNGQEDEEGRKNEDAGNTPRYPAGSEPLGNTIVDRTVRRLEVELEDALAIAEGPLGSRVGL